MKYEVRYIASGETKRTVETGSDPLFVLGYLQSIHGINPGQVLRIERL